MESTAFYYLLFRNKQYKRSFYPKAPTQKIFSICRNKETTSLRIEINFITSVLIPIIF